MTLLVPGVILLVLGTLGSALVYFATLSYIDVLEQKREFHEFLGVILVDPWLVRIVVPSLSLMLLGLILIVVDTIQK